MKTFKLSPSSLRLMKECKRCFWLTQHGIWKRPASIFPGLPAGMDRILKTHFDRFMERGELPPELCENGECAGMKLFKDKEKLDKWRNNLKGVRYEDEDGNILMGAMDNILEKEGKLIVFDYKTRGHPVKEDTAKFSQDQLNIYTYLLQKNGYETEDYAFLLFYIPKEVLETGEVIFDTKLIKMPVDVKDAEKLWKSALDLLNGECPAHDSCEWCAGF